jgi:hypothetical protein
MRKTILFGVLLSLTGTAMATIPVTSPSSRVKADPSLWDFNTQGEMDNLIRRNYENPRASYYLVNNAYQKGFATHAALMYLRNAKSKRFFTSKRWVSAAYSAAIGGGDYAYSLHTPDRKEYLEVMQYGGFLYSQLGLAVKETPNSPEVLMMSAATLETTISGRTNSKGELWDNPEWRNVFSWLKRAQKLDPTWADAQYWYGASLEDYWADTGRKNTSLLLRAKTALLSAQRLDPNMAGSCAWRLWLVARDMKRPEEQLRYMRVWFARQPRYANQPFFRDTYAALVRKVGQAH